MGVQTSTACTNLAPVASWMHSAAAIASSTSLLCAILRVPVRTGCTLLLLGDLRSSAVQDKNIAAYHLHNPRSMRPANLQAVTL
jgi:hypothetical protein